MSVQGRAAKAILGVGADLIEWCLGKIPLGLVSCVVLYGVADAFSLVAPNLSFWDRPIPLLDGFVLFLGVAAALLIATATILGLGLLLVSRHWIGWSVYAAGAVLVVFLLACACLSIWRVLAAVWELAGRVQLLGGVSQLLSFLILTLASIGAIAIVSTLAVAAQNNIAKYRESLRNEAPTIGVGVSATILGAAAALGYFSYIYLTTPNLEVLRMDRDAGWVALEAILLGLALVLAAAMLDRIRQRSFLAERVSHIVIWPIAIVLKITSHVLSCADAAIVSGGGRHARRDVRRLLVIAAVLGTITAYSAPLAGVEISDEIYVSQAFVVGALFVFASFSVLALLRRGVWHAGDYEAFGTYVGDGSRDSRLRLGLKGDTRTSSLIGITLFFLVVSPLALLGSWEQLGPHFQYHGQTQKPSLADMVLTFGLEVLRAVPLVDWTETFNIPNDRILEPRDRIGTIVLAIDTRRSI